MNEETKGGQNKVKAVAYKKRYIFAYEIRCGRFSRWTLKIWKYRQYTVNVWASSRILNSRYGY